MIVGAAIIQWETPGRFDADGLLRAMENMGNYLLRTTNRVPNAYSDGSLTIQTETPTLHECGEPLNPEVIRVWKNAYGLEIYDFFGQTETFVFYLTSHSCL